MLVSGHGNTASFGCRVAQRFPLAAICSRNDRGAASQGDDRLDSDVIVRRIELLRQEHRDLDSAIDALLIAPAIDQLQIARIKKRKLRLKDEIAMLEDMLIPDIIA